MIYISKNCAIELKLNTNIQPRYISTRNISYIKEMTETQNSDPTPNTNTSLVI